MPDEPTSASGPPDTNAAAAPREAIARGLEVLATGLGPYVAARCREVLGEDWARRAATADPALGSLDPNGAAYLLRVMIAEWHEVFDARLSARRRALVGELHEVEARVADGQPFGTRQAAQSLGSIVTLLNATAAGSAAGIVERLREEVLAAPEIPPPPSTVEAAVAPGPADALLAAPGGQGGQGDPGDPEEELPPPEAAAGGAQRRRPRFDAYVILGGLGRTLITLGTLILLFVGYQLWGTGLYTERAQHDLKRDFEAELRREKSSTTTTTEPDPSTSSTAPAPTTTVAVPPPPAQGEGLALLSIPDAGVDKVVAVQGTARTDLAKGPGHYEETPLPGQNGNSAIAGHRTTYAAPFYDLDSVKLGSRVTVDTLWGRFVYRVSGFCRDAANPDLWNFSEFNCQEDADGKDIREPWIAVRPNQTEVVPSVPLPPCSRAAEGEECYDSTQPIAPGNYPFRNTITLTTCNPRYSASERLVVRAELDQEKSETEQLPPPADIDPENPEPISISAGDEGAIEDLWPSAWWGLATLGVGGAWFFVFRLRRRVKGGPKPRRFATGLGLWVAGAIPFAVVLFFFYVHLERLLPSSY